jgi:hypothetical protein
MFIMFVMFKRMVLLGPAVLLLAACSNGHKSFRYMTEEELFVYNQDKAPMDQVVCQERRHTSSRIRKNICLTVREIVNNKADTYQQLGVINSSMPAGAVSRGR